MSTKSLIYAPAPDSEPLPVIDITHPAFRIDLDDEEIARLTEAFVEEQRQRPPLSDAAIAALRRSRLGAGIMAASGTFLTSLATYLLKLGPVHFGETANPIDQRIAASFPVRLVRLRLQDMAELLAEGIRDRAGHPRPLRFLNIAGGPAADSWNALIQLRASHPDRLATIRDIAIIVLDLDPSGPAFGARALDALSVSPGPLQGLDAALRHLPYEWSHAERDLPPILDDLGLRAQDALCAISSEGGLFEYGSDAEIVANLTALRAGTPADALIVGSVTRRGEASQATNRTQTSNGTTGPATRPRSLDEFRALADAGGWSIDAVRMRPFSFNLRLVKTS